VEYGERKKQKDSYHQALSWTWVYASFCADSPSGFVGGRRRRGGRVGQCGTAPDQARDPENKNRRGARAGARTKTDRRARAESGPARVAKPPASALQRKAADANQPALPGTAPAVERQPVAGTVCARIPGLSRHPSVHADRSDGRRFHLRSSDGDQHL